MLNFIYKKAKATSFIETMIVLIIAGVFFSFAAPSYARYIEKNKAKRAASNLETIYNMEKMYKMDNGVYFECDVSCASIPYACPNKISCTIDKINDGLGLTIIDPYFSYKIEPIKDSTGAYAGDYKATATKIKGTCTGGTLTLTSESRNITVTGCTIW